MQTVKENSQEQIKGKPSTRRRPERLFVSLNEREKTTIEMAASEAQINVTEWARSVLLDNARRITKRLRKEAITAAKRCNSSSDGFEQIDKP